MYRGYHRKADLPLKQGDVVTIAKGTKLRSTHPQRDGEYEAGRTYQVKVHHVLPGATYTFGHIVAQGTPDERVILSGIHWRDLYHICQGLGVKYAYSFDPPVEWIYEELKKTGRIEVIKRSDNMSDIKLHTTNPQVNWAGSGGYWVWCDINDIVGVQEP